MTPKSSSEENAIEHGDIAKPHVAASKINGRHADLKFSITVKKEFKVVKFICVGNKPMAVLNKATSALNPHTPHSNVGDSTIYSLDCTIPIPRNRSHIVEITHGYEHGHELIVPLNHKTNHDVLDPRG